MKKICAFYVVAVFIMFVAMVLHHGSQQDYAEILKHMWPCIWVGIIILSVGLVSRVLTKRHVPQGQENVEFGSQKVVCWYSSPVYIFMMDVGILSFVSAVICSVLFRRKMFWFLFFLVVATAAFVLTALVFLKIMNRVVVFYENGVLNRDIFGRQTMYRKEQIWGYHRYRGIQCERVHIRTKGKQIVLNSNCTDYWKMIEYLQNNYKMFH